MDKVAEKNGHFRDSSDSRASHAQDMVDRLVEYQVENVLAREETQDVETGLENIPVDPPGTGDPWDAFDLGNKGRQLTKI